MPQGAQIVPELLQPHVMTVINDNTQFTETTSSPDTGVKQIFVFPSYKGRDGVVLDFSDTGKWIDEYGIPNYKLFGQANLMPHAALSTGYVKAFCMRIAAPDATYSNAFVVAKVKVDTTDSANKKLIIRFVVMNRDDVDNKDDFEAHLYSLATEDPDIDGFITLPLFVTYALGRGSYGDAIRFRLVSAIQLDRDNDYKNYRMQILELENTLAQKDLKSGSFFPDALNGYNSLYIQDVINDPENGSIKIGMQIMEESFQKIYDLYKTINPDTTIEFKDFDFFGGLYKNSSKAIEGIVFDTAHADHTSMDNPEGIPLSGGDDGKFKEDPKDPTLREAAIEKAYLDAFNGVTNRQLLSTRRAPANLIMDANYPDTVKRALVSFIIKRGDAFGYIDGGILNTVDQAIDWGLSMQALGNRIFSKEPQHFKVRDRFSGKVITVTMTYFLTQALPLHFRNIGNHVPFTGEDYATLSGIIKGSLRPAIDADDTDAKEEFTKLRMNYFMSISEKTIVRGCQTTSQNIWSDLSEENNMHILLELKRKMENLANSKTYNFAEAEDRKRFKQDAAIIADPYKGTKVRSADVDCQMTPWEEERSILHWYLAIVYKSMAKRHIVEIDVNKRV